MRKKVEEHIEKYGKKFLTNVDLLELLEEKSFHRDMENFLYHYNTFSRDNLLTPIEEE